MPRFVLFSADGEEGYPGNLVAKVTYSLPSDTQLKMEYHAVADAATPTNLTNHTYWNLKDGGATPVLDHEVELPADFYIPVDDTSIPLGEVRAVSGAMDLRAVATIREHGISHADQGIGYDHNWCLRSDTNAEGLRRVARVYAPESGRWMTVHSNQPGVQFYTGNYLDGSVGRNGVRYGKHHGFCLETQHFPDSVNQAHFPSTILEPGGKPYMHTTMHTFGSSAQRPSLAW